MTRRILLPGAGTGTGNNLIRSLREDYPGLVVVGANDDRFTLRNSKANRNYLVPDAGNPRFSDALRTIIERERIDLLIPNTDADVSVVSDLRDVLPCRTFLPSRMLIERCQDPSELSQFLRAHDVPAAAAVTVRHLASLDRIFARFTTSERLWCRPQSGAAAGAAAPVDSPEDARSWISYWERVRGVPATDFTLSEYMPGRDFACQSLWKEGRLVLVKTSERLAPSGTRGGAASSIGTLVKTVNDPRIVETCGRAIRALDPRASGAFSINLREGRDGVAYVVDIHAGRFFTMMNFFDFTGRHNMSAVYVRLALDEPVDFEQSYDVVEDRYFIRGVDTLPAIFCSDQLSEGIEAIA